MLPIKLNQNLNDNITHDICGCEPNPNKTELFESSFFWGEVYLSSAKTMDIKGYVNPTKIDELRCLHYCRMENDARAYW